jgi:hypothetical protein
MRQRTVNAVRRGMGQRTVNAVTRWHGSAHGECSKTLIMRTYIAPGIPWLRLGRWVWDAIEVYRIRISRHADIGCTSCAEPDVEAAVRESCVQRIVYMSWQRLPCGKSIALY